MKPKPRLKPRTVWLEHPQARTLWNGRRSQGLDSATAVRVRVTDARDPTPEAAAAQAVQRVLQAVYDDFVGFSSCQARLSAVRALARAAGYEVRVAAGRVHVK